MNFAVAIETEAGVEVLPIDFEKVANPSKGAKRQFRRLLETIDASPIEALVLQVYVSLNRPDEDFGVIGPVLSTALMEGLAELPAIPEPGSG